MNGHMNYQDFLESKVVVKERVMLKVNDDELNPNNFPHQNAAIKWAASMGRALIAASFGLGKTRIQSHPKGGHMLQISLTIAEADLETMAYLLAIPPNKDAVKAYIMHHLRTDRLMLETLEQAQKEVDLEQAHILAEYCNQRKAGI